MTMNGLPGAGQSPTSDTPRSQHQQRWSEMAPQAKFVTMIVLFCGATVLMSATLAASAQLLDWGFG